MAFRIHHNLSEVVCEFASRFAMGILAVAIFAGALACAADPSFKPRVHMSLTQQILNSTLIVRGSVVALRQVNVLMPDELLNQHERRIKGSIYEKQFEVHEILKGSIQDSLITVFQKHPQYSFKPSAPDCTFLWKDYIILLVKHGSSGYWVDFPEASPFILEVSQEDLNKDMLEFQQMIERTLKRNQMKESLIREADLIILGCIYSVPVRHDTSTSHLDARVEILDIYKGSYFDPMISISVPVNLQRGYFRPALESFHTGSVQLLYVVQDASGYRLLGGEETAMPVNFGCLLSYQARENNYGMTLSEYRQLAKSVLH